MNAMDDPAEPSEPQTGAVGDHRCQGRIWRGYHYYDCTVKPKVEREGKWFCGTHDPVRIAEKKAARDAEDARKSAERRASWEREANARAALIKDAERYRWFRELLKTNEGVVKAQAMVWNAAPQRSRLDAMIDEARTIPERSPTAPVSHEGGTAG